MTERPEDDGRFWITAAGIVVIIIVSAMILLGCDGASVDTCVWLTPGHYKLTATAVSLDCPDFDAEVDYQPGPGRDNKKCVETGHMEDSEWALEAESPTTAVGRLESTDCIWTIRYERLGVR